MAYFILLEEGLSVLLRHEGDEVASNFSLRGCRAKGLQRSSFCGVGLRGCREEALNPKEP